MYWVCCLGMTLLLTYPAMADTVAPTTGVAQAVPAAEASSVADTAEKRREILQKRVTARWDALIRKDFAAAYSFNSPAYRTLYSKERFQSSFGNKVNWKRVEVVKVDFKGEDAATVGINLYIVYNALQMGKPIDMKTYVEEPWVYVDGQWWYLMKD